MAINSRVDIKAMESTAMTSKLSGVGGLRGRIIDCDIDVDDGSWCGCAGARLGMRRSAFMVAKHFSLSMGKTISFGDCGLSLVSDSSKPRTVGGAPLEVALDSSSRI